MSLPALLERFVSTYRARTAAAIAAGVCCVAAFAMQNETIEKFTGAVEVAASSDLAMRQSALLRGSLQGTVPVAVVDIDDDAMRAWGAGTLTPRARIASIIGQLAKTRAAAVVVDIDLTDPYDHSSSRPDPELARAIETYPASGPRLLLTRPTSHQPVVDGACGSETDARQCPATLPPSPYELDLPPVERMPPALVAGATPNANVAWVTASFLVDDDGLLRRWRLWEVDCHGTVGQAVASAALYLEALRDDASGAKGLLRTYLQGKIAQQCFGRAVPPQDPWPKNQPSFGDIPYLFGPSDTRRADQLRPFFNADSGAAGPPVETTRGFSYLRISATSVEAGDASPDIFAGRIVLVGSTHRWSGDTQLTPLGPMPGVVVVANAIAGYVQIANSYEMSWLLQRLLEVIVAAIFAATTLILRPIFAGFAIATTGYVAFLALSQTVDPSAATIILRSALILLAAYLVIEVLVELLIELRKGAGWKVVLKPPPSGRSHESAEEKSR